MGEHPIHSEDSASGVRNAYDSWASTYDTDRNLTRDLDQQVTRGLLGHLRCTSVLEIGCGTGKNTALLAEVGGRVTAADFSEGMIARARARVLASHVAFVVADLRRPWPWTDQSADLVVCNLVLEHIEDLAFVFAEASRVLAGSGQLLICELHPFRQYQGTRAAFQHGQAEVQVPAFVHHLSDFLDAAARGGLALKSLKEWWHVEDRGKPPRLVSFLFGK